MNRPDKATIIQALEANGGNAKKTAIQLGIPRSTLRYIVGRMSQNARAVVHKDTSPSTRDELAERWRTVANKGTALAIQALAGLDAADLKARDVKDLLIASAVATDKHQLLTGGATSRTESLRISLVGAADLRTLSAQIAVRALPAPDVVEGTYIEEAEGA